MINGIKAKGQKWKKETLNIKISHFIALGTRVKLVFSRTNELKIKSYPQDVHLRSQDKVFKLHKYSHVHRRICIGIIPLIKITILQITHIDYSMFTRNIVT